MSQALRAIPYIKVILEPGVPVDAELSELDSPVFRPLADGLMISYLVDCENQFEYVQHRLLRSDGVTEDQLHESAMANLRALAREKLRVVEAGKYWAVLWDGNFEASALLLPELWEHLDALCPNGCVVAVPCRDVVAIADAGSYEGIEELKAVIDRVWPIGDHLLTRNLYLRENDAWAIYR